MKIIRWILLMVVILLISGCTFQRNSNLVKEGKYVFTHSQNINTSFIGAWIELKKNNQFEFNRSMATSYRPSGTYSIQEDTLTFVVSEDEFYRFKIEEDELVFVEGSYLNGLIEEGSVFEYSNEN